jgi:WD40 repeat protein
MNTKRAPRVGQIVHDLTNLFHSYDATSMLFLDRGMDWKQNPTTTLDRISCELCHHMWKALQRDELEDRVVPLIEPFMHDGDAWQKTQAIAGVARSDASSTEVSILLGAISLVIEYCACQRNAELYVPDYDFGGKLRQEEFKVRAQGIACRVQDACGSDMSSIVGQFVKSVSFLGGDTFQKALPRDIFGAVCIIIAEEERVRQALTATSRQVGESAHYIEGATEPALQPLGTMTVVREALLRPCLEVLHDKSIPVTSGLQYEASSILGCLGDTRAVTALREALHAYDYRHTNIRCNIIYALGNCKHAMPVQGLIDVLAEPDSVDVALSNGTQIYRQPLHWEKREAVWALGKYGVAAIRTIPALASFATHSDRDIRLSLAWALGTIGIEQKVKCGGIEAEIVTTLLHLLSYREEKLFEEAASSLRKLGLPDFLHSLYLHNLETATILSLKPSSAGLYEFSETLFYLLSVKKPVVVAVTGDSGTGKTYFCESIMDGFGDIGKDDILYLMRDNPGHKYIFHRLLGIRLLKELVDPEFYQNYPLSEQEDDPSQFFREFMTMYGHKKLIILDGWLDDAYFYPVLRAFYAHGFLDAIVNFRTAYSTKRLNLEEREGLLDTVRTCLSYVEKPAIEETEFYREGHVIVYNLDNSRGSRLNKDDIHSVFERQKIDTWGEYIRVGAFESSAKPLRVRREELQHMSTEHTRATEPFILHEGKAFSPDETRFVRILNDDIDTEPSLLQTIEVDTLHSKRLIYYTQGQLACCGYDGSVSILIGANDHMLYTFPHSDEVTNIALLGEEICSVDRTGCMKCTSFRSRTSTEIARCDSPVCSLASDRKQLLVSGHEDGTVRLWDFEKQKVHILHGHRGPVLAVAVDHGDVVLSGGRDGELRFWSTRNGCVAAYRRTSTSVVALDTYPQGRCTAVIRRNKVSPRKPEGYSEIMLIDHRDGVAECYAANDFDHIRTVTTLFDGRIIVGMTSRTARVHDTIAIVNPHADAREYVSLSGHKKETRDCVLMGPRIISCGSESDTKHTIKIWGTETYVRRELSKLRLLGETKEKPAYYRTLF